MARTRHTGQEALHQSPDDVGRRAQLQLPPDSIRRPLREHVQQERQRQRVTVRELKHPALVLFRDTRAAQERARIVRREVAQRDHTQQVAPSRIVAPRLPRTVPARHHDQRGRRQPRDKLLAQPILEPDHHLLERVEQQHHRRAAGKCPVRGQGADALELGHECRWRRLDRTQIEAHDADAGIRGRLGERAQQHGLANPAGTV
jgi:hypothetical protein